eukprot:4372879-Pyramimonas_sp.AAC.1
MDKEAGTLSVDCDVTTRVVVNPSDPPKARWNLGAISDPQLVRADLDRLANDIFLPKRIEWSGQRVFNTD